MHCPQCGKEFSKNAAFCDSCGASLPKRKEKKPFPIKIVLCVLLAVSLLLNLFFLIRPLFQKTQVRFEGKGFDTPEEAITAYAEAFRDGDVDKMISTFAIESYVENFDQQKYIERIAVHTSADQPLTNDTTTGEAINCYARVSRVSGYIRNGYYVLLGLDATEVVTFSNKDTRKEDIAAFLESMEDSKFSKQLSRIEIGDVLTADDFDLNFDPPDYYEVNLEKSLAHLDVSDIKDLAIEIEMNGEDYYLFMCTAKINGKWYNISIPSSLGTFNGATINTGGFIKQ